MHVHDAVMKMAYWSLLKVTLHVTFAHKAAATSADYGTQRSKIRRPYVFAQVSNNSAIYFIKLCSKNSEMYSGKQKHCS